MSLQSAADRFLAQKRIAVVGALRDGTTGHGILTTLRRRGHEVVAVNPHLSEVAGVTCHPDLHSVPSTVDAVVVVTPRHASESVVRDCVELGISHVWLHQNALFGAGNGSASETAVELGRKHGLNLIAGACPLMFGDRVDVAHKCMRWILRMTHKLPDAA